MMLILIQNSNLNEMHEKRLNQELTKQNYLADKNARLVERENISRNIHNSVGHSITAAIMTLDAADMLYDVMVELGNGFMECTGSSEVMRNRMNVYLAKVRNYIDKTLK